MTRWEWVATVYVTNIVVSDIADRQELHGPGALLGPEEAPADLVGRERRVWS